jgi:hypothetical protein
MAETPEVLGYYQIFLHYCVAFTREEVEKLMEGLKTEKIIYCSNEKDNDTAIMQTPARTPNDVIDKLINLYNSKRYEFHPLPHMK